MLHRRSQYLNNLTEQNHWPVKQRFHRMLGFGRFELAARFCSAFHERRHYFRVRRRRTKHIPLAEQRRLFVAGWRPPIAGMAAA